jgi:mycofactocin precursor
MTDEPTRTSDEPTTTEESVTVDVLVEEVSIDGMCGVY